MPKVSDQTNCNIHEFVNFSIYLVLLVVTGWKIFTFFSLRIGIIVFIGDLFFLGYLVEHVIPKLTGYAIDKIFIMK